MTDIEQTSQSVEHVYAAALLELAASDLDNIREQADDLGSLIRDDKGLALLIESRVLSSDERAASIEKIFKGNVDDLLYRFIQVVNAKDRLPHLGDILETFGALVDQRNGIIEVDAYVAAALDDATAQRVTADLSETLGGNVVLHQHVDETLIGGLKLRIGDKLIDASVATQLRKMKKQIVDAGREKTRGGLDQFLTA